MNKQSLVLTDSISDGNIGSLLIYFGHSALPWFNELLQRGFYLINPGGISIEEFLTKEMGLSREYIGHKISTILLDGKVVNDIESAIIKRGSVLALSSAMPGFVGVNLRSGGMPQPPNESCTSREISIPDNMDNGVFCVKLFNLPMLELGSSFFRRGILLRSACIEEFLSTQPDAFWKDCTKILLNNKKIDPSSLDEINLSSSYEWLRLLIHLPDEGNRSSAK
jgi:hypothetical protein